MPPEHDAAKGYGYQLAFVIIANPKVSSKLALRVRRKREKQRVVRTAQLICSRGARDDLIMGGKLSRFSRRPSKVSSVTAGGAVDGLKPSAEVYME